MKNLTIEINQKVATITINRPEVKNALNAELILELTNAFKELDSNPDTKITVITGAGNIFCSGADLNWLREVKDFGYEENLADSEKLVDLLDAISQHSKTTIAKVIGSAVGGGVGIILSCDLIFANSEAIFGVSEVAIGIIPAAIVHLLIERIGLTKAKEYLITGNRITAKTAQDIGLINYSIDANELDKVINTHFAKILSNGTYAISKVKEMINKVEKLDDKDLRKYISKTIADLRTGDEAKEGIAAFLEKRKPNW